MMVKEWELLEQFRNLNIAIEVRPKSLYLGTLKIHNDFLRQIKEAQQTDKYLQDMIKQKEEGKDLEFYRSSSGIIKFKDRVYIP